VEDRENILFWKEYIEELYKIENTDKRHRTPKAENENHDSIELTIMMKDIKLAIKELKLNKALGIDNLNSKLLIALERIVKEISIITNVYGTGKVPEECIIIQIIRGLNVCEISSFVNIL
jgi:hypothetical protein